MANKDTKHTITRGQIEHICTLVRDIDRQIASLKAKGITAAEIDEISKNAAGIFHTIDDNTPEQ